MSAEKAKPAEFIVLKNGVRFSKIRSVSIEAAKGSAREKFAHLKGDYLEILTPAGRIVPLY